MKKNSSKLAIDWQALGGRGSSEVPRDVAGASRGISVGAPEGVRVTVIDVGKGDCILVQVGEHAVLIDAGYEATSGKVVSYLRKQGIGRLDCLIVTHYDRDHVGGIGPVGNACSIGAIYLPGYMGADRQYRTAIADVRALGVPTQTVTDDIALELGEASLVIWHSNVGYIPNANGDEGNDNDCSLVVSLAFRGDSYLFAGDLEEEGIAGYLAASHGSYDVLKMPHHGEKKGNLGAFIAEVQPKIAVITDCPEEPADKKTLKVLKEAGVETYRTGDDGTVVVESDGAGSYSVFVGQ